MHANCMLSPTRALRRVICILVVLVLVLVLLLVLDAIPRYPTNPGREVSPKPPLPVVEAPSVRRLLSHRQAHPYPWADSYSRLQSAPNRFICHPERSRGIWHNRVRVQPS